MKKSLWRRVLKRLSCNHAYIYTNDMWSILGVDHVSKVCVKCGKIKY